MTTYFLEQYSRLAGTYPAIANRADFVPDDDDTDPVYMTVPIGEIDTVSANDRLYDRQFYEALVKQVNEAVPPITGIVGHENPENKSFESHLPVMQWVGATIDENGIVWGKTYIYPDAPRVRASVKRAKRQSLQVATSIDGHAIMEGNRATKPILSSIDYVTRTDRAGVASAVAIPQLTQEMNTQNKDTEMSETLITELRGTITTLQSKQTELQQTIAELQFEQATLKTIRELTGNDNVVAGIQELIADRNDARRKVLSFGAKMLVDAKVKYEGARAVISEMIGLDYDNPINSIGLRADSVGDIEQQLDKLLDKPHIKEMIQAQILLETGGRAIIGNQSPTNDLDTSAENAALIRQRLGF